MIELFEESDNKIHSCFRLPDISGETDTMNATRTGNRERRSKAGCEDGKLCQRDGKSEREETEHMEHRGTKVIETERLTLRPFRKEDAEDMYRNWASDPEVTKFLTWPAHRDVSVSGRVLEDWISGYKELSCYHWAIELKEIHEPIGSISATETNDKTESATVGYCIGRRFWGQGITAEALGAVIAFFFDQVGMNCVNACHDPRNPNSGKVMRKCGMTLEGTWRARGVNNQGRCDETWYSILKEEYPRRADAES